MVRRLHFPLFMAILRDTLAADLTGDSLCSADTVDGGGAVLRAIAAVGVSTDETAIHARLRAYRAEWSRCMQSGHRADAIAIGDAIVLLQQAYGLGVD